jgi:hypothetical protein
VNQIVVALQFRGEALPDGQTPGVVHVRAIAPSCHFTTSVRESGVEGAVRAHGQGEDGRARIEAQVRLTSDHTYHETGVIAFGDGRHQPEEPVTRAEPRPLPGRARQGHQLLPQEEVLRHQSAVATEDRCNERHQGRCSSMTRG